MSQTKYVLVLSGGGFKGSFQVGALEYIYEHGLLLKDGSRVIPDFDIVTGVSVGALNGALVASNQFDELQHIWFEELSQQGSDIIFTSKYIDHRGKVLFDNITDDLLPPLNLRNILRLPFKKGRKKLLEDVLARINGIDALADNTPLYHKLKKLVKRKDFEQVKYRCGLVKFDNGQYYSIGPGDCPTDDDLARAIQASATIPVVWSPIEELNYRDQVLTKTIDGGLRNNTPLSEAIDLINEEPEGNQYHIVIITNKPEALGQYQGNYSITKIAQRSLLEITFDEIAFNDINQFKLVNHLLRQVREKYPEAVLCDESGCALKEFDHTIITPIGEELGDMLDTTPEMIQQRRELGRKQAKEAIENGSLQNT
mgnify:CR=1 FL=1